MRLLFSGTLFLALFFSASLLAAPAATGAFPPSLESYNDAHMTSVWEILKHRAAVNPFNVIATILFACAVLHTFFANKFLKWSHELEAKHAHETQRLSLKQHIGVKLSPSVKSRVLHFLGEIEAVFGIWVIPLLALMVWKIGLQDTKDYMNHRVNFTEPIFVVVIMAIAATRPVMRLAESGMSLVAKNLFGGGPSAWWMCLLTIGPILGSFITEPAAMTICASLLGRQFYERKPTTRLAYATLGLLFVNISVGGTLTHFAAPPVLMVATAWGWDTPFMLQHFGWIAVIGIVLSNVLYFFALRGDFAKLSEPEIRAEDSHNTERTIPAWVTALHILFLAYAVVMAHYPVFLIGGFLLFTAVHAVTDDYQSKLDLRMPILVGFFLAGLVIHGTLQQWWIEPVISKLSETPLMLGSIGLTAFNDNAAITYLASLVPSLTDGMKYAVVAGAVTGGGLTVIANAPNPAGQAILSRYFPDGVEPLKLVLGALIPTIVMAVLFLLLG